jgi:hypothetical protein
MATDDILDEFFDFAQLEHDNGMHGCGVEHEFDIQVFDAPLPHDGMDWHPTGAAAAGNLAALRSGAYTDDALQPSSVLSSVDVHPSTGSLACIPTGSYLHNESVVIPPRPQRSRHDISQSSTAIATSSTLSAISRDKLHVQSSSPSTQPQRSATVVHKPASAKRKGPSTRIPAEARQMLEEEFAANPYPCSWEIDIIAHQANLDVKRVRNWYNNTRARKKTTGQSCHCSFGSLFLELT